MSDFRIIYMGTPEFAVPALQLLLEKGYDIPAVVTAPDKPRGRGQQLAVSAVKSFALRKDIKILQPVKLKDPEFIGQLRSLKADLQVVVAFRMLPEVVWSMPSSGTINLHASLLPEYRGAAPINWAIMNGESKTGLTTFFIDKEIDTGKIILQEEEPVYPEDDAGSLHDRMMKKGAELVLKSVKLIEEGNVNPVVQPLGPSLKKAPKITREMCEIDFNGSAVKIRDFIRGLSPYPGAWTILNGKVLKIFRVTAEEGSIGLDPGQYITDGHSTIRFMTGNGIINVQELQVEGKKRMQADEFLRGNKL